MQRVDDDGGRHHGRVPGGGDLGGFERCGGGVEPDARGGTSCAPYAVEGFHCDASPDITYVDVCGTEPAGHGPPRVDGLRGARAARSRRRWPAAAAPRGGAPPAGTRRCRPWAVDAAVAARCPFLGGGDKGKEGGHGGPHGGPSSGTVDITYTYTPPTGCEGAVTQDQAVTFSDHAHGRRWQRLDGAGHQLLERGARRSALRRGRRRRRRTSPARSPTRRARWCARCTSTAR